MKINNTIVLLYRKISFLILASFLGAVVVYVILVLFYFFSNSWAAPLILSPSQERVLSFQPQITALQTNLNKQRIELQTAQETVGALITQIEEIKVLIGRITIATNTESEQLEKTGREIQTALRNKQRNIRATDQIIKDATKLLKQIDEELAAKLITEDQAAQRRISLQAAINSATDARTQAIQLEQQARQLQQGSSTLTGGASSLTAMTSIKQVTELKAMLSQMEIQLNAAKANVIALETSIKDGERVFEVAKTSPYHRALFDTVNVAFVPYENLDSISENVPIYDCFLKIIICQRVGKVIKVYDAEEYAIHPLFKTDLRGKLIEIEVKEPEYAKSQILFIGRKPLFF